MMHPSRQPESHGSTEVEPSRLREAMVIGLLFVGLAVDIAAFQLALSVLNTQMTSTSAWGIAIGLGAIAMLLMAEAGYLESVRRSNTAGNHGKGPVRLMIFVWLSLGVIATMVRTSVAPPTDSDPFAASGPAANPFAAAGADPFGGVAGAAESAHGSIDLGLFTLYSDDMLSALLMLALYAGVGIAAYLFGRSSHHPSLTHLRRSRRVEASARRKLRRLESQLERSMTLEALRQQDLSKDVERQDLRAVHAQNRFAEKRARKDVDTAGQEVAAAQAQLERAEEERRAASDRVVAAQADLNAVEQEARHRREEAVASGQTAKSTARHLLHVRLSDPVRTVMDPDVEIVNWRKI